MLIFPPKLCVNSNFKTVLLGEGFICILCGAVGYKKWFPGVSMVSKKLLPYLQNGVQ
jgi:hypothetical protein